MKKVLIILSTMLLALSCCEIEVVKIVDLATLTADYEAQDGDMLTGIISGNYKITIADGATVMLKMLSCTGSMTGTVSGPASPPLEMPPLFLRHPIS